MCHEFIAVIDNCHLLSSQVFRNSRGMTVLKRLLQNPASVIALNCKAGFHRTSAFIALLSCVLFAPLLDRGDVHCFIGFMGSIHSGTSVIDTGT